MRESEGLALSAAEGQAYKQSSSTTTTSLGPPAGSWRREPGPTDVLSFPMDDLRVPEPGEVAEAGILGDVVICPQVAARQGEAAGHGRDAEMELLLTHGVLHLLGHDHAEPDEHVEMFGLQDDLLRSWTMAQQT